jgi:hypothetical protein
MRTTQRTGVLWVALASASVLIGAAVSARAEDSAGTEGCDALVDHLRQAPLEPAPAVWTLSGTDYRVRESRVEDWLRSIDRGRVLRCATQEPAAHALLESRMDDRYHPEARALCVSALASWPEAEKARRRVLAQAVRLSEGWTGWEVDEAVAAGANVMGTPELREELVPILAAARARRARGYDRLRAAVCTDDGQMSDDRAGACSMLPAEAERGWRRSEQPRRWLQRGLDTATYAGVVAAVSLASDHGGGRPVATAAAACGGAAAGVGALWVATRGVHYPKSESDEPGLKVLIAASGIAGGILGGVAGHAFAASPRARAPVTAVGLAPLYLMSIAGTFD